MLVRWLRIDPHSFKVKSQTEFSPFPQPPTPRVGGWGAGGDAGEVCRGTSAEQMCRPVLQPLISIDLFGRQLWVFRLEGLRAGGPWPGVGVCSQDGGAAWQRRAGLWGLGWALRVGLLDGGSVLCQRADGGGSHPAVRLGSWGHSGLNSARGRCPGREPAEVDAPCCTDVRLREVKPGARAVTNRLSCLRAHREPGDELGPEVAPDPGVGLGKPAELTRAGSDTAWPLLE